MKKFDILVIGELNVDLILSQIQSFPEVGKEVLARDMTLTLGSSSAIFACNSSALGAKVTFLGKIGNDYFGTFVRDSLRSKNVNTDYIIRSSDYKTGATVAMNFNEDRAMITHPGAMEYLGFENISSEIIDNAKHLHISSVFLQPQIKKDIVKIFKLAKAKGLTTSLDTQWDPIERWDLDLKNLLPHVDVFIPNEVEILALTKQKTVKDAIDQLKGFSNVIAVKMGNQGSLAWSDGKYITAEPYLNTEVIDAIGAGDSFDAGFVTSFIRDNDIEKCLKLGNLAGAINTTAPGGTSAFTSFERIRETAMTKFKADIMHL
jgi:sugar/nucleoside kinase (ribokinase family)